MVLVFDWVWFNYVDWNHVLFKQHNNGFPLFSSKKLRYGVADASWGLFRSKNSSGFLPIVKGLLGLSFLRPKN